MLSDGIDTTTTMGRFTFHLLGAIAEMERDLIVAALQANPAWRDIPVVVVTALDLTAEDHRRLNGGVEQILSKSAYAPAELIKRVGALLAEAKRKTK